MSRAQQSPPAGRPPYVEHVIPESDRSLEAAVKEEMSGEYQWGIVTVLVQHQ